MQLPPRHIYESYVEEARRIMQKWCSNCEKVYELVNSVEQIHIAHQIEMIDQDQIAFASSVEIKEQAGVSRSN
jgi:hypothetical protein